MGRIICGQVIAGTGPDLHGPGIGSDVIRTLFYQMQRARIGGVEHDMALPPAARASNFRLTGTADGGLKILADIEVLDEEAFRRMGGFSISFTRTTVRIGRADKPAARVLVNPEQFDFDQMSQLGEQLELHDYTLDVTELIQKAALLQIAVIALVIYSVAEIGKAFLAEVGADLYRSIRRSRRVDNPAGPVKLQLHLTHPVPCILDVNPAVSPEEFARLGEFLPADQLPAGIPIERIARAVGRVDPGPSVRLLFIVLDDGSCIEPGRTRKS